MPAVEGYDTETIDNTIADMLKDVSALEGIQLKTEKTGEFSDYGKLDIRSDKIRSYKKVLESDFTYVELILYFNTDELLKRISNENESFNQQLNNIDNAISSIISRTESAAAIARGELLISTRTGIIVSAVIAVIVLSAVSILLLHLIIVKRLTKANNILYNIADGDLTKDIVVGSKDEIGDLFVSMQKMQEKISHNIELTLKNGEELSKSSADLLSMSTESHTGIQNQKTQIDTVVLSIDDMNSTTSRVSEKTSLASEAAKESLEKSALGRDNVDKVISTIDELSKDIKESEELIHTLNNESKAISSILDVITGISEKTNLLALNAAIEAARAGDTGRGFAVVADEVRALASSTQTSANDIRTMVERLSLQTDNAVKGMKKSRSNADSAVQEIFQTGEVIKSLSSSISLMNDINLDITSAANEQTSVSKDIHKNINCINEIGIKNTDIATQVASNVSELNHIAAQLKQLVSYFTLSK